jgi:hypothetical protein
MIGWKLKPEIRNLLKNQMEILELKYMLTRKAMDYFISTLDSVDKN